MIMSTSWDSLPPDLYLSLAPWCWVQLESADPPGPFRLSPALLRKSLAPCTKRTACSRVRRYGNQRRIRKAGSARRPTSFQAARRRVRRISECRPYLSRHIKCGRRADGRFQWDIPFDLDQVGHRYQRRSPYFSCGQAASHSDRLRPDRWGRSSAGCWACWTVRIE